MEITKDIRYVGVDDHDIDLFEGQYDVSENGMAYNSYVILGEKIAVADSVDGGFVDEWLGNLEAVLDGRTPDYLVIHHMEPDLRICRRLYGALSPGTDCGKHGRLPHDG